MVPKHYYIAIYMLYIYIYIYMLVTHQLDQKKHENVGKTENVDMLCVVGFTI